MKRNRQRPTSSYFSIATSYEQFEKRILLAHGGFENFNLAANGEFSADQVHQALTQ